MVVRKPTPAGASIPVSSSSCLAPHLTSLPTPSNDIFTRVPTTTQGPFPDPNQHSKSNPKPPDDLPQHFHIVSGTTECLPAEEIAPAEKPLPFIREADRSTWGVEDLHTGPSEISKPALGVSERATPRSSQESERSRDFWEEGSQGSGQASNVTKQSHQPPRLDTLLMSTPGPATCFAPPDGPASSCPELAQTPDSIRSKNPFRRGILDSGYKRNPRYSSNDGVWNQSRRGKSPGVDFPPEIPIEMRSDESLYVRPLSEYSASYRPPNMKLNKVFQDHETTKRSRTPSSITLSDFTPSPPPVSSSLERTIGIDQPTSIPVSTEVAEDVSMRPLQSTLLDDLTGPAEDRAIKGENAKSGVVADLEKELPTIPQADTFPSAGSQILASLRPLVPNQGAAAFQYSTSQQPHLQGHSPSKATRLNPSLSTTVEAEIARLKEQRNETYQIKHFNWFDHNSRTLRRSSMLTQNKNGPCPLLALVNALILGVENDSRSALGAALRTREQVSLGLIIESLIDELTSEGRCEELTELPDVDELNRFLLMLHTGMTANPRLAASASPSPNLMDARNSSLHLPLSLNNDRKPGTFETTRDMRLYGAFAIPLVHGWLAPRSDPARAAFARSAQTYEDAQTIQFGEEELEDKLSRVGLNPAEQQLLQDITFIKSFLESYPTQITPYGLGVINESLFPGAFAILFRNDHFSTIYKHPESGQLFTLVTDAGYSDKDEVIWESLVDVSGQNSEFFSGDFRPVGNADATNEAQQTQRNNSSERDTSQHLNQFHEIASAASPQEQQQQADADFAMALQLQEEEQARMDDSGRHLGGNDAVQNRNPGVNNSQSTRERDGSRPTIPTRNARYQGATRPVNPSSDEAPPPAYEEAAKGKPYLPPVGHPQHPSFDGRSPDSGPSAPVHPPGPRLGQAPRSRMSASQEWQFHSNSPLTPPRTNNAIGVPQNSARVRDKDKDCTVM